MVGKGVWGGGEWYFVVAEVFCTHYLCVRFFVGYIADKLIRCYRVLFVQMVFSSQGRRDGQLDFYGVG